MKKSGLKLLAIVGVGTILLTSGCSSKAEASKVNVVCEDVSYIQQDSKPTNIEDGGTISLPENTVRSHGFIDNENLIIHIKESEKSPDSLCLYNINTKKLKEITKGNNLNFNGLSGNRKKILYGFYNDGCYIYDIEKATSKKIIDKDDMATFADFDGKYVLKLKFGDKSCLEVLDTETAETKTCNISNGQWELCLNNGKFINNKFYFEGSFNKRIGIYSLDIEKMDKIDTVFLLPKQDNCHISQFDFINNGKSIIFSGNYEKQPGVYIYDLESEEITKVASGLINQPEGNKGVFYSISNDKTKILLESHVNNSIDSSIYLAEIHGNSIISNKCLYKKAPNTYGALCISSWWSSDDSFFLIDEKEFDHQEEWIFDKIRKFNVVDDNK